MHIRQPIIVMLGHIDHGKTTILDKIRGTAIQKSEAGGITQHIGATEVPLDAIKKICGPLLKMLKTDLIIPGLLFIDTPGHEAFTSLRERGSSIADLAVLVIDIFAGVQPQTLESLHLLRTYKVPFVVAANKIDLIPGWKPQNTYSFLESIKKQDEKVIGILEEKIYSIAWQLEEQGFRCERFDRVTDFTREVCIVPTSGITGEGIAELLMLLAGLSQKYLQESLKIEVKGPARGSVVEVKDVKGLGTTIDVIIYDGTLRRGDYIVVGGIDGVIVTKVRSILKPPPLRELREAKVKKFVSVDSVSAAAGVKIVAPNLDGVIPGSPLIAVWNKEEIDKVAAEVEKYIKSIRFESEKDGIIVKADSLGSLEAIMKMLKEKGIPVKVADIGPPTKRDVLLASDMLLKDEKLGVILVFNEEIPEDIAKLAEQKMVKIISGNIIYRILEEYEKYCDAIEKRKKEEFLKSVVLPAKLYFIPGHTFRVSKPAIIGVEVVAGLLRPGVYVINERGKRVGYLRSIQSEGKPLKEAKAGDKVAVAIEGGFVGRNIKEGEFLYVDIPEEHFILLKKNKHLLPEEYIEVLREFVKLKRKEDPTWGRWG